MKEISIKNEAVTIISFLVFSMVFFSTQPLKLQANPLIAVENEFGVFLPSNHSYGVLMQNASILYNLNASKYEGFHLDFEGNYTFYNKNDTRELTVAAPFSFYSYTSLYDLNILANNNLIPHTFLGQYDPLRLNISSNYTSIGPTHMILANITFPTKSITIVEYSFSVNFSIASGYSGLRYIVGTANYWDESYRSNETVEFRIYGYQPDSYSSNCTVSEISKGTSYLWKWENERIETAYVGVGYDGVGYYGIRLTTRNKMIAIIVPTATLTILIAVFLVNKKRKLIKGK